MSWKDKIENTIFTIRTGDGKLWYPDFPQGSESTTDFNAAVFDFINKEGSLVVRKKAKADKYPLLFVFQGEDNIDQSNAFLLSAKDSRAWVVHHPYYGDITGQPLSIFRDSSAMNITRISVDFLETITSNSPKQSVSFQDNIASKAEEFHVISSEEYGNKVALTPADVNTVKESSNAITAFIDKTVTNEKYNEYQLAKNRAVSKLNDLILYPTDGIYALQTVIMEPALFNIGMEYRFNLFKSVFRSLINTVTLKPVRNNKLYFEAAAGSVIAAMALALTAPQIGDFDTRIQVNEYNSILRDTFNEYRGTLDSLYTKDVKPSNSYAASAVNQESLQSLVGETINGLVEVAFNAKQERIVTTDKDEHLIVLVHRYLGLDKEDKNIDSFRKINNIRNKFLFLIPKGTTIRYYV